MHYQEFVSCLELKTGQSVKKQGTGHMACCPAHDDHNPSLSIKEASDGKILLRCFAGCPVDSICASLGLEVSDLFVSDLTAKLAPTRIVYSYKDEQGRELYRKVRVEPGVNGKNKNFYSEHVNENGEVISNLHGCRRVLYRLPEIIKGITESSQIFLVEGEKDADKLVTYGLNATTSPESLKWTEEFTEMLAGGDIIILYDMDEAGIKRKELLCENLHKKVKRLRVVDLPGLEYQASHGADVSDWLAMGHTINELKELIVKAPDYSSPQTCGKIRSITLETFLEMSLPPREMMLSPFLPIQGLTMIYAKRGVGKTHVALGIAGAVARGGTFLKWHAHKSRKVLFIDGEMPASAIQERFRRMIATDLFDQTAKTNLRLITPDLLDGPMPNLSTQAGRDWIEEDIAASDLIIIDNISSLFRSGVENEAESWQPAQDWALQLRKQGKSILFVHHAGKGGQQRGSSKKEDILDTVICLKHPTGYRSDQGARFQVEFEKTRNFAGEDATSFLVELQESNDGLWNWRTADVQVDPDVHQVAELHKQGLTIQEITEQSRLTKAKVEGRLKKAREHGLIE